MTIGVQFAIKVDDEDDLVKVARRVEIDENTEDRELTYLVQELKFLTKMVEDMLYDTWREKLENDRESVFINLK